MQLVRTSDPVGLPRAEARQEDPEALAKCDALITACAERGLRVIVDLGCHRPDWAVDETGWTPTRRVAACVARWGATIVAIRDDERAQHGSSLLRRDTAAGRDPETGGSASGALAFARRRRRCARRRRSERSAPRRIRRSSASGLPIAGADLAYLQALYNHGLADAVDAICCHPYGVRFAAETVRFQRPDVPWGDVEENATISSRGSRNARRHEGDATKKRIWVTSSATRQLVRGYNGTKGPLDVTEEEQAAWLAVALRQAAAIPTSTPSSSTSPTTTRCRAPLGYEKPVEDRTDWFTYFGLVDYTNQRAKPAYHAVAETILSLP